MSDPPWRPVTRLLVANRGEIARRIIRTAREMGIVTAAVYVPADADAPHVAEADAAVVLGGGSYLDGGALLAAARAVDADAVHPGYGFLSENAAFARSVEAAGLIWVGPPPAAIAAMGDKLAAKQLAGARSARGTRCRRRTPRRLRSVPWLLLRLAPRGRRPAACRVRRRRTPP